MCSLLCFQVLVSIFIAEGLRAQMIFKGDQVPGEHGFDPRTLPTCTNSRPLIGRRRMLRLPASLPAPPPLPSTESSAFGASLSRQLV